MGPWKGRPLAVWHWLLLRSCFLDHCPSRGHAAHQDPTHLHPAARAALCHRPSIRLVRSPMTIRVDSPGAPHSFSACCIAA
uniref:Putative secreted peptide n=1 Tax=Anopheles braziliensis TaxID=58242 RepID=A0A2M3ZSH8_9DIPT